MNQQASASTSKSYLFYSPRCDYSREILGIVKNASPQLSIVCVNIDVTKNLPRAVNSIPMIIIDDGTILKDEDVFTYVTKSSSPLNELLSMSETDDSYSFLNEDDSKGVETRRKFEYVSEFEKMKINDPSQDVTAIVGIDTQGGPKLDSSAYKKLTEQRESDYDTMMKSIKR